MIGEFKTRMECRGGQLARFGAADIARPFHALVVGGRRSQSLFEGSGPASSMVLAAVIIVEGVPAQSAAAADMAHTGVRPAAATGRDRATRATSHTSPPFSLRKGSAREPQRLSRRRFPLISPCERNRFQADIQKMAP